jgi:hypothetical protein
MTREPAFALDALPDTIGKSFRRLEAPERTAQLLVQGFHR